MERVIRGKRLELVQGDIVAQHVDAIVNAANSRLAVGGGVDGAIHRRGGPSIHQETRVRYPDGCPTGSAVISTAGALPARYVIHAVGPVWKGGECGEPELLASAHRTCLEIAAAHDCRSLAFPAISTGIFGYPVEQAARVALKLVLQFFEEGSEPLEHVRFVLFDAETLDTFAAVLTEEG